MEEDKEVEIVCVFKGKVEGGVNNNSRFFEDLAKQIDKLALENGLNGWIEEVFEDKKE